MDKQFGVITEQGFPVGKFGFEKLNEQDNSKVTKDKKLSDKKKA